MKGHDELLTCFNKHASDFLTTSHDWRRESSLMYQIYDNRPLGVDGVAQHERINDGTFGGVNSNVSNSDSGALTVVSLASPYLKATIGMMAQYRKTFYAYSATQEYEESADIVNDAIKWAISVSDFNGAFMDALTDAAVVGVGALAINVNYKNSDYAHGVPIARTKRHLFFDRGAEHASDMQWCGYADPVDKDALDEELAKKKGLADSTTSFREQFMEYTNPESREHTDFIISYFYKQTEKVIFYVNPIATKLEESTEILERNPITYEFLNSFGEKHNIDFMAENVMVLTKAMATDWAEVQKNIKANTGLSLPKTESRSGEQDVFYRAKIARGILLEHERSFCQSRHELLILPAYYDRYAGVNYGLMRGAAQIQLMLNKAMANLSEMVRRNSTGGTLALTGAGTELLNVIRDIKGNEQVIALPQGTVTTTLSTGDAAQANQMLAQLLIELIPLSFGISKEMLGQMNTDTPAASLFQAAQKQMQTSLAHLSSNIDTFIASAGLVMRDAIKHIVRGAIDEVTIMREKGSEESYVQLTKQKMLQNYHVSIQEQDFTHDQRHQEFIKLMEFMNTLAPEQRVGMLPALIESSPLDYEQKKTFLKSLEESAKPNPQAEQFTQMQQQMQMEQMQANTRMINAQASQLEQQAAREQSSAQLNQQKATVEIDKAVADIENKEADTIKKQADAAKVIVDIGMQAFDNVTTMEG